MPRVESGGPIVLVRSERRGISEENKRLLSVAGNVQTQCQT